MATSLNWVDYIILAIFFFSILSGFMRGFVREIVSLITLIAAFVIASMFANKLAAVFTGSSTVQNMVSQSSTAIGVNTAQGVSYAALGISFALLFAGTVIIGTVIGYMLNIAFQAGILGVGNRLLGALFGLVRGFIINLVVIFVVQLSPFGNAVWWHQSYFVTVYQPTVQWLGNIVSPSLANLKQKFTETLQGVGSQFQGVTNTYTGFGR